MANLVVCSCFEVCRCLRNYKEDVVMLLISIQRIITLLVFILWLRGCDLGTMWEEFRGFVNLRNDRTSCAPISVTLVLTLISIYLNSTHLMFHFNLVLFPKCLTLKSSVRTHFSENSAVFMGYPRLHKNNISDSMDCGWLTNNYA